MKIETFKHLRLRIAEGRTCALVTALDDGRQALVDAKGVSGDLPLTPDEIAQVRAQTSADRSRVLDNPRLFVRVYGPQPRMIIVGAVHIAQVLAPMARLAGFDVTVVDPRERFVSSSKLVDVSAVVAWPDEGLAELKPDARTAIVTLTHDTKLDDPALHAALKSPAFYIGALGSQKSHAKRVHRLTEAGFKPEEIARIHGPVGLDINALTPAEIAVSIIAQVVSVLRADVKRS
jgi:xanthine dehydrogenase accessory factor